MISINRSTCILKADPKRVVLLYNSLGMGTYVTGNRSEAVVNRVLKLSENEVIHLLQDLHLSFAHRHKNLDRKLLSYYDNILKLIPAEIKLSNERKLLLGAHFAKEYSIQSAALFNPSIVPHPNQDHLNPGEQRFIISLRSVGEGHISSIEFRQGILSKNGEVSLEETSSFASCAEKVNSKKYKKSTIRERTRIIPAFDQSILDQLPYQFTTKDCTEAFQKGVFNKHDDFTRHFLLDFIDTNYNLRTSAKIPLSERVISPRAKGESMGMEDVRFVEFRHDDGRKEYIGTYTAYNGLKITPQLILTDDFIHFRIRTMFGKAVSDKGFALFPEKINGKFVMTARQGGEDLTIMKSDNLYIWDDYEVIMKPQFSWGLVQQGNCGSPIKTEKGWLLLTHAVGPIRKYVISAILLDLKNPYLIIGKLDTPLIMPKEDEREGYVPNVVYSCGAMKHNDLLIIPYAMSDSASSFATISVSEILKNMSV